ncbi:hypothetical protein [Tsukamurella paurometabola]|uniref:HEPN domain-containing protein n=1 Tax=Tsukamurella paurometabola TaxID=2061 RepID=A0ABS5NDW7_TSUPA|nr:hypothetical protein [Tsukamurella paurometabola]MBS4102459.1 hypothetical protein [Tsukamurella paurometabola]
MPFSSRELLEIAEDTQELLDNALENGDKFLADAYDLFLCEVRREALLRLSHAIA